MDTRARIHGPVGRCRHCGQEFMRKGSLERHEQEICDKRPDKDKAAPAAVLDSPLPPQDLSLDQKSEPVTYKPRVVMGGTVIWTRQ